MQPELVEAELNEQSNRLGPEAVAAGVFVADPDLQLGAAVNLTDMMELARADQHRVAVPPDGEDVGVGPALNVFEPAPVISRRDRCERAAQQQEIAIVDPCE